MQGSGSNTRRLAVPCHVPPASAQRVGNIPAGMRGCPRVAYAAGASPESLASRYAGMELIPLCMLQVISLEGWSDIMYYVQDAHSFWDWIYFVLLIVVS